MCAGVFVGLPALYTVAGVFLAYPWFFVPLLVVVCAVLVDHRNRRRASIIARANFDYRQEIAGAVFARDYLSPIQPPATVPVRSAGVVASRHVLNSWPTTPMLAAPMRRLRRPRTNFDQGAVGPPNIGRQPNQCRGSR
ncbi:hypothetical protein [Mycobacterium sp. E1319]|uniref:hypothetical protein n=1 Tax=Mycobacterium sp. E1319 TaxID=1834124 RepID=UPI001E541B33|nr:hypothetical protein [Mycobacterium sp. E1319]